MDLLKKDIAGYPAKEVLKVLLGVYVGFKTVKYFIWRYRNKLLVQRARRV